MFLTINGEKRVIAENQTLGEFLAACALPSQMVVVERNGEIVPREKYDTTSISDGDILEIVQMMAGG